MKRHNSRRLLVPVQFEVHHGNGGVEEKKTRQPYGDLRDQDLQGWGHHVHAVQHQDLVVAVHLAYMHAAGYEKNNRATRHKKKKIK